jgi:hypothetical protein
MMKDLRITNRSANVTRAVLEPWGEIYELSAGRSIEVHFEGEPDDAIEVSFSEAEVKIWAPGGVVATVRDSV